MFSESSSKRLSINYTCSNLQNVNTVKKKNSRIIIKDNQDNQDGLTFYATKNDSGSPRPTTPTLIKRAELSLVSNETDDLICENKHTSLQKFINKPEASITPSNAEKDQADEDEDDGK
jgi:hypothetical protein